MVINKGDIVLVNFPFTDLSQTKLRPALVLWLSSTSNDVTLCAITSQNISSLNPENLLLTLQMQNLQAQDYGFRLK